MYDLETRIEQWRADLTGSETISRADVAELEAHLRDELAQLTSAGLAEDEAFVIAVRRLGDRPALETEFAKAHPHRYLVRRLYWIVVGILGYSLIAYLTNILSWIPLWLGYLVGLRTRPSLTVLGFISHAGCFAILAWYALKYFRARARRVPRQAPVSVRAGILMAVAVAVLSWSYGLPALVLHRILPPHDLHDVHGGLVWGGQVWAVLVPFLLATTMVVVSRRRSTAAQGRSETMGEVGSETQSRLCEQVQQLTALGLSADEAALLARRRFGVEDLPTPDATEDGTPRPLSHTLFWMALGILGYLLATGLAEIATGTSVWLSYSAGAQYAWLLPISGAVYTAVFAVTGLLLWRYAASPAEIMTQRPSAVAVMGLLLAAGTVGLWQVLNAAPRVLVRSLPEEAFLEVMRAWSWAGTGRFFVMPFLLAVALAVLSRQCRRTPSLE